MQPAGAEDAELWREREIGADIYGISFECGKCLLIFFFKLNPPILTSTYVLWRRDFKRGGRTHPRLLRPAYIAGFCFIFASLEIKMMLSCHIHPLCSPAFFHLL